MFPVSVCKGCGRTIESKFVYCPWCGQSKVSYENQDSMETETTSTENAEEVTTEFSDNGDEEETEE